VKFLVMLLLVPCFSYANLICEDYAYGNVVNEKVVDESIVTGKAKTTVYYTDETAVLSMGNKSFNGFKWNNKKKVYENNVGAYLLVQEDKKNVTIRLHSTVWLFTTCK